MPLSSRLGLWLAGAAVCAEALVPALLHVSKERLAGSQGSACACLPWHEAYNGSSLRCGLGNEFRGVLGTAGQPDAGRMLMLRLLFGGEFCNRFYMALQGNQCVNMNQGADEGQWCYVSPDCTNLQGGARVAGGHMAWKHCGAQDAGLRSYMPEALAEVARVQDLDLGLLHKMSYPLFKGHLWRDVQAFWGLGGSVEAMPAALREQMQSIVDSGKPYSFDTAADSHPPHKIVVGMKVYTVSFASSPGTSHPGTWCKLTCQTGCS